jgi:F-type H+-transporting ATPase subunit b
MLQLEPGMMIWTWVTFLFLFFVLAKVAWKPLLKAVNQREKNINDSLKKAEQVKAEAEELMEKQQKMLVVAQEDIRKVLKENKETAEKIKIEIVEKAKVEAEKLHQRAQTDIERETDAAIIKLKKQVADLAIQAASKLIRENLDEQKHRNLIDNYIKDLDQINKN